MQGIAFNVNKLPSMEFRVSTRSFDLDATLDSAQCFAWNKLSANPTAWRGVVKGNEVVAVQHANELEVYTALVKSEVERYFGLDKNVEEIIKSLVIESEHDEVLLTALNNFPGLRILKQDAWETILSFICSQNSNVPMIKERVSLLRSNFGSKIDDDLYAFPTPEKIASLPLKELAKCKLGYRAGYLRDTALLIVNKKFDLNALEKMPFEQARSYLLKLPGVGEKVADCVCLFALGHLNAFPVDTHVFQLLVGFYEEELLALQGKRKHLRYGDMALFGSKKFGDYCGYGQQYLFQLHRVARQQLENVYN